MTILSRPARVLALSSLLAATTAAPALAAAPGTTILVSRPATFGPLAAPITNDSATTQAEDGPSHLVADDDTHRYIAFVSDADGLSDADDDRVSNVYVRDRLLAATILVSRADGPSGAGANGLSGDPSISSNGRFVAFASSASNLAPGVTGAASHVYVRDLVSGTTRLVDRADGPDGAIADDDSFSPSLTVVGGNPVVAFTSAAGNLDGASAAPLQVYVRDEGPNDTAMVSRTNAADVPGNGSSSDPAISTDGTNVAFASAATDLVVGDGNGRDDVFVRTRASGVTRGASIGGNGDSGDPSISGDGNEVAFASEASNLSAADLDAASDVYVRDLTALTLTLMSRATGAAGAKGNQDAVQPAITDDGGTVVFSSRSDNLVTPDGNQAADVFMRSGTNTSVLSRPRVGVESDGSSTAPSIARLTSPTTTRLTAFQTTADNMGASDDDDFAHVYSWRTGVIVGVQEAALVSRPTGTEPFRSGVNGSHLRPPQRSSENAAALSADGRYAVFLSDADELSTEDDNRFTNVFRRDNLTGATTLVSRADGAAGAAANATSAVAGGGLVVNPSAPTGAPAISADGNRIAFVTAATNLAADDGNALPDVFVRDVAAATTVLASRRPDGTPIPAASGDPALSGDGNRVAFATGFSMDAMDVANADVYLRELAAGTTVLVSRRGPGAPAGNDDSSAPALDADGSHVAFHSSATDLQPTFADANLDVDVFVREVAAGPAQLVSRAAAGTATGNDGSSVPAISADGNRVAFSSGATNLGGGLDVNGPVRDVFVRDMAAATTTLVSRTAGANGISGNGPSERASIDAAGTRVAFETLASDLVPGDVNGLGDVLVRDTAALTTELVSLGAAQANGFSGTPSLSGNGDCVVFETFADNVAATPPGTDFDRVAGRALRGDCPFGPVPDAPPLPGLPAPPAPPGAGADTTAPVLSKVRLAPRRFRAGSKVRARTRRRPATGARVRFTLSEAATVTVRVDALLPGRRAGRRCVKPRAGRQAGRACVRAVRRGTLTLRGRAGANRFAFPGTVARKLLGPGRHRATFRAADAAGNRSIAKKRTFSVLRP